MNSIPKSISLSIDLNKIDKTEITLGKNGAKYLDIRLVNTPDNQYGSDYMVTQGLSKDTREKIKASGEDYPTTPILGNANAWQIEEGVKNSNGRSQPTQTASNQSGPVNGGADDDLPF